MLCNNCLHKPVCGKFRATGGQVQKCDHLIANKERYLLKENGDIVPLSMRWIPVTERLPEEKEPVLILCKNGAMFVGYCGMQYADIERRWRIKTALNSTKLLNLGRVTHWMPLPEPPTDLPKITDQTKNALEKMGEKAHGEE